MKAFRSRRWLLAVLVVVLVSAAACGDDGGGGDDGGSASGAPDTITIGYQAIPNGDLVVKSEGWLEEAFPDSEIEWTLFDSGGSVNEAVVGGQHRHRPGRQQPGVPRALPAHRLPGAVDPRCHR